MAVHVHLIDETWIDAPADTVSDLVHDPATWPLWWPNLDLTVTRDRGLKGMQWAVDGDRETGRGARSGGRGPFQGSVEIWLEPFKDGVILHHFLRLEFVSDPHPSARAIRRATREFAWHAKRVFWRLKDDAEASRPIG